MMLWVNRLGTSINVLHLLNSFNVNTPFNRSVDLSIHTNTSEQSKIRTCDDTTILLDDINLFVITYYLFW